jgi:PAS domain S-box-containing protein
MIIQRNESTMNFLPVNEAQETLHAIRSGTVDAFVVEESDGHRVYTLEGADLPYSELVERMQQGAAMLNASGEIIYCNPGLTQMLDMPREALIGISFQDILDASDRPAYQDLLQGSQRESSECEMRLRRTDGTTTPANFAFRLLSRDKSAIGVLVTDLTTQKLQADLTVRLQRMQDEERRRLARELHDSVGQLLVGMGMNNSTVQAEAHKLSPDVAKLVFENGAMILEISNEIRTISHLLHPPLLDEVGLPSALRWYIEGFARRSKIETTLDIPDNLERLPQEMEIAVFRAVQECLTNVHRHSGSASCAVKIVQDENRLRVEIRDSGCGIPKTKQSTLSSSGGVGLRGLQERLHQLGGTLTIESGQHGTVITGILVIPRGKGATSDVA